MTSNCDDKRAGEITVHSIALQTHLEPDLNLPTQAKGEYQTRADRKRDLCHQQAWLILQDSNGTRSCCQARCPPAGLPRVASHHLLPQTWWISSKSPNMNEGGLYLGASERGYCLSSRAVVSRGADGSCLWSSYIKDTPFMLVCVPPFKCLRQRGCASVVWDTDIQPDSLIWRTANIKAESRFRRGDGQLHLEFPTL